MPMKTVFLLVIVTGVVSATKHSPEHHASPPESHDNQIRPAHQSGHSASVIETYDMLLQQLAEVKSDNTLSMSDKQKRLGAIHHQLGHVIHRASGVPGGLLFKRLAHPAAETLRQQFLKRMDNILKSTTISNEQRISAIGLARNQYRHSLEAANPARRAANTEAQSAASDVAKNLKSAVTRVMREFELGDEARREEMKQQFKKGMRILQEHMAGK